MEGLEFEIHSKGERRGKDRKGTCPIEETAKQEPEGWESPGHSGSNCLP